MAQFVEPKDNEIECFMCGATVWGDGEADVIKRWNTRSSYFAKSSCGLCHGSKQVIDDSIGKVMECPKCKNNLAP